MIKTKAQKAKGPPGLTLTFGDERRNLSVDALRAALENALDMLQNYQSDFITASTVVRWEIAKVRMQSPLAITFEPKIEGAQGKQRARRIVTACEKDLRVIEINGSLPKHFNEDALIAMQKLLAVAKKEEAPLSVGKDKRTRFALTERSTQHIEQIVSKVRTHSDHSTIDGILSTVTVRGGKGFAIYDVLTDKRIECNVRQSRCRICSQASSRE